MCAPEFAKYVTYPTLVDECHAETRGAFTYVFEKNRSGETITVFRDGQKVRAITRAAVMRCAMAHVYYPATGDKYVRYHFLGKSGTHAYKVFAGRIKNACRTANSAR